MTQLGTLKHILIKGINDLLYSIMIVCLLTIFIIYLFIQFLIMIVSYSYGLLTLCYQKLLKLLSLGIFGLEQMLKTVSILFVFLLLHYLKKIMIKIIFLSYSLNGVKDLLAFLVKVYVSSYKVSN